MYTVYSGDRPGPMVFYDDYVTYAGLETGLRRLFTDQPPTFRAVVGMGPIVEKPEPCDDGICFARDPMEGVWELVLMDPAGTADELLEAVLQAAAHAAASAGTAQ